MEQETLELLLNYLRWPLVVLILGLAVLLLLRAPFGTLLTRISQLRIWGAKLVTREPPQATKQTPPTPEETKALQRVFDNQLLVMVEELVKDDHLLKPITDE